MLILTNMWSMNILYLTFRQRFGKSYSVNLNSIWSDIGGFFKWLISNSGLCFRFSIFAMKWVIMERGACGKTLEPRPRRAPVSSWNKFIYGRYLVFHEICLEDSRAKSNFMLFNMLLYINAKSTRFSWFSILSVRLVMILRTVLITVIFSTNNLMKTSDISH